MSGTARGEIKREYCKRERERQSETVRGNEKEREATSKEDESV